MATHTELVNVPGDAAGYASSARFCLDEVERDDADGRTEWAFVWRGNQRTPDGFQLRPAYFDWELLGRTIRLALTSGKIPKEAVDAFERALAGK